MSLNLWIIRAKPRDKTRKHQGICKLMPRANPLPLDLFSAACLRLTLEYQGRVKMEGKRATWSASVAGKNFGGC